MSEILWKLLIADDEPKIRRGLRTSIEQMGLQLEICGEAEDGEEALALTEELRPDFLLVDINMPFMNGLDLVEKVRRARKDIHIILITGYGEFEFARRALEMNVQSYLLKPVDTEKLRNLLEKGIEEMAAQREHNRHFEWAISQIGDRRDALREEFLRDCVSGRLDISEIRDFRVYFEFPAPENMQLAVISVFRSDRPEKPWEQTIRRFTLQGILQEDAKLPYFCVFQDDAANILILYNGDTDDETYIDQTMRRAFPENQALTIRLVNVPVDTLTHLNEIYDRAINRLTEQLPMSPIVESARKYITQHFSDCNLSLAEVADALNVHSAYLSRLMKQELGIPFAKYLTNMRIGTAARLMRESKLRIREVAEQVGYSNQNYFSVAFKKVFGISPLEYRAEGVSK